MPTASTKAVAATATATGTPEWFRRHSCGAQPAAPPPGHGPEKQAAHRPPSETIHLITFNIDACSTPPLHRLAASPSPPATAAAVHGCQHCSLLLSSLVMESQLPLLLLLQLPPPQLLIAFNIVTCHSADTLTAASPAAAGAGDSKLPLLLPLAPAQLLVKHPQLPVCRLPRLPCCPLVFRLPIFIQIPEFGPLDGPF